MIEELADKNLRHEGEPNDPEKQAAGDCGDPRQQ